MQTNNYINGQWVPGQSTIKNINPSDTSDIIGEFAQADVKQLNTAIESAEKAQKEWANSGLENRYNVLMSIGQELMAKSKEIGHILSREEGKPLLEGIGEVYRSGQFFTYYAAEVLRQIGDNAESVRLGVDIDVRREAVGLVAVISPWNFPIATASWKIAPALAFGNAVIWKPANLTPASAIALAEIIDKQKIPQGLFSLILGAGSEIGQALVESKKVKAISFTGSVETGRNIITSASQNFTKVQMEMGSKNALVILDDADLDLAVNAAMNGAFGGTGQKCTASSRLILHEKIHDQVIERLIAATKNLNVGHALKEGTQIGPVSSETQFTSNLNYLALAKQEGCEIVYGGERVQRDTEGYYMTPAILTNTQNQMRVNKEEMFAPIVCTIKAGSYEEALALTNDTEFGLTSGIFTQSLAKAAHFKTQAKTGCVMINLPTAGTDYHVPFGGRGISSYGSREQGQYAVEFYTTVKTAYISSGAI